MVTLSLMDPAVQSCPFEFYRQVQTSDPVHRMPETGFFLVTRYDDVRAVLGDPVVFSNRSYLAGGLQAERMRAHEDILAAEGWPHVDTLQRTDPPVHTRYRSLLNRAFTPRRVRTLAARIDEVATGLVDGFAAAGTCEFVSAFAVPLPGIIIAEQLGLDASQIETFKRWAEALLAPSMQLLSQHEIIVAARTEVEAQHHLAAVFDARRADPDDSLISALVHAHARDEEPLTTAELQNLLHQLVSGGFETTTGAIAHGMWLLLRYPDQMAKLRARPELIKGFIEEVLRIESPVQGLVRRTTCDVTLAGVDIPAGSTVIVRYGAANRDEEEYPDAGRFDIERANAATHLAFGVGNHFCVGAALARQEMLSSFTVLLRRLDDIKLAAPLPDPAHHPSLFLFALKQLQLSFRAKGGDVGGRL